MGVQDYSLNLYSSYRTLPSSTLNTCLLLLLLLEQISVCPWNSGKCWVLLNCRSDQHGMGLAAVLTFFCLPSTPHVTGLHFMAMSFCWEGNYGLYALILCLVLFFLWLDITTESDAESATDQDVASASLSEGVASRFLEDKCQASGTSHRTCSVVCA